MEDDYAIGLDLGTTFSCIGVYRNGGVEIIPNSIGEKITPSVVVFEGNEILVGEDTTDILVKSYSNCIYEVKRLIGLDFTKNKNEFEQLPFKVIKSDKNNSANIEVEVEVNGKKEKKIFTPVEISSLIIKKMVHNAENYLNKKVKKLVITVPAYFNEDQKKMTQQAAEMLNLDVIRIINEPIAAALAYGFTEEKLENKKILVFDLGGGTFDVSILAFENEQTDKEEKRNLTVLSKSGDMHLGGEDFDKVLVDYVIKKQKINQEIKNNKEAMKRLKVACENTKKILSLATETTLRINNLYKDENKNIDIDINMRITRKEFVEVCKPLFNRLEIPLKTALSNKGFSENDIDEVILIGGSTRIPEVKVFINNYFNKKVKINDSINADEAVAYRATLQADKKVKINDSINADEAVAYGATLQAEKILYNNDQFISNLHILDITPFSLGVSIINNSKEEEIKKEGDKMSVIIKRGTSLPAVNTEKYETVADNQTEVCLKIYEGEKKYVKYNHLLKETTIKGLTPKPKGETKISVEFKIDINGILYVKAIETSVKDGKTIDLLIKNDEISFSKEEMEKMKEKMENMTNKLKYKELTKGVDYTNLKETLKTYKDAFDKSEEDEIEDKKIYLENFNETMEEFIDGFGKKFDNETLLEKFYLYIKELFVSSYINYLKLPLEKSEKIQIFEKIKKYLEIFTDKSSGYLNNLLEILFPLQNGTTKRDFNNVVIFIMEKLNDCGIECIKKNSEFCKYHSLMYFEQSLSYYEKYLSKEKEALFEKKSLNNLKKQKQICFDFINDINSGAIIFVRESLLKGEIFDENTLSFRPNKTGLTENYKALGILNNFQNDNEKMLLVLREYEKVLASIQISDKPTEKEAICIANILKLNSLLALIDNKRMHIFSLADRCKLIIDQLKISNNKKWCKEFSDLYKEIQKLKTPDENYHQLFERIRNLYPDIFDELDRQFNQNHGKIEFINYITTRHPYREFENDKKTRNFKIYNNELISFLQRRYQPENYMPGDEISEKNFCINHEITSKLGNLLITVP